MYSRKKKLGGQLSAIPATTLLVTVSGNATACRQWMEPSTVYTIALGLQTGNVSIQFYSAIHPRSCSFDTL